ncbi:MAG TPA: ABC transporter permease [Firmicutes bacterium]|jgi:hypothetical protein|nr:ABC transporter permease [Bacillota bacterium]
MRNTGRQMLIGGIMLVAGWLVIFAGVVGVIPSSIWLNMVMYAVTLFGFMLGMVGAMSHIRTNLRKHREEQGELYDDYDEPGK